MNVRNKTFYLILGSVFTAILILSGCTVQGTSDYYMPVIAHTFPPKPKDAPIPILDQPPKRPYLVIGRMAFQTDNGLKFVHESLQYNARRNGADAVILRLSSRRQDMMDVVTKLAANMSMYSMGQDQFSVEAEMIIFQ